MRRAQLSIGLLLLSGLVHLAYAQSQPGLSGTLPYGQFFPAEQWIPLQLQLRNPTGRDIAGYVAATIGGDHPAELRRIVHVPARSRVSVAGFVYFPPAQTSAKPITTLMWYDAGGGVVAREPMLAKSLGADENNALPARLLVVAGIRNFGEPGGSEIDAMVVSERVGAVVPYALGLASVDLDGLPRTALGYESALAVLLEDVDLEAIDLAQREALLAFVRGGGTLVLPAPGGQSDPAGTWLEPYLPVRIVGWREADQLPIDGGPALKLSAALPIAEAVPGDGTVVLAGGGYVHAAYRSLGKGRVLFTSFPAGALAEADKQDKASSPGGLWAMMLAADEPGTDWSNTELGARQPQFLQRMIGKSAPPWGLAFGIVAGYLLLMLAMQLAFGGARRPLAFAGATAIALAIAGGLFATRSILARGQPFMVAGVATLDVGPGGGGELQESLAYIGINDPGMALRTTAPSAVIRSLLGERPIILLPEFTIPNAGVMSDRVDNIWKASAPLPTTLRLDVEGRFGSDGLELSVDNGTGGTVEAPLLLVDDIAISLRDLPAGQSTVAVGAPNPRGSYVNATVFTSDSAKLRGDIIAAMVSPARSSSRFDQRASRMRLIGWMDDAAVPTVIQASADVPPARRRAAAVRADVRLLASAPGTDVRIGRAFVQLASVGPSPLYDFGNRQWIASRLPADLDLSFGRPSATGDLRLRQATLEMNIDAPRHEVIVRRQQVRGGKHQTNPTGAVAARWTNPVGPQAPVTFDLSEEDVDDQGRLWLSVSVEPPAAPGAGEIASPWQIRELGIDLRGQAR